MATTLHLRKNVIIGAQPRNNYKLFFPVTEFIVVKLNIYTRECDRKADYGPSGM